MSRKWPHLKKVLRETEDYFIARCDDDFIRIGLKGVTRIDTPHRHDELLAVAAIKSDNDFNGAAENLFDGLYLSAGGGFAT